MDNDVSTEGKANTLCLQGTDTAAENSVILPLQSKMLSFRSDPVPAPIFWAVTVIFEWVVYAILHPIKWL